MSPNTSLRQKSEVLLLLSNEAATQYQPFPTENKCQPIPFHCDIIQNIHQFKNIAVMNGSISINKKIKNVKQRSSFFLSLQVSLCRFSRSLFPHVASAVSYSIAKICCVHVLAPKFRTHGALLCILQPRWWACSQFHAHKVGIEHLQDQLDDHWLVCLHQLITLSLEGGGQKVAGFPHGLLNLGLSGVLLQEFVKIL